MLIDFFRGKSPTRFYKATPPQYLLDCTVLTHILILPNIVLFKLCAVLVVLSKTKLLTIVIVLFVVNKVDLFECFQFFSLSVKFAVKYIFLQKVNQSIFFVLEMSAKKKKNALGVCDRCQCYFLNRDFEKHPQDCQIEAGTSHIRPESAFVGTSCQVEKREAQLPSDAIGWTKYNTVLLNPNTVELLGVLPRTACVLSSTETGTQIAVIWPCAEVS